MDVHGMDGSKVKVTLKMNITKTDYLRCGLGLS